MAIQVQHPYVDDNGAEHENLIKTFSDDGHQLLQVETGIVYDEAIDIYPCAFTYEEVEEENQEPLDPEAPEVLE